MATQPTPCPTCGLRLDAVTGLCAFCTPVAAPPPAEGAAAPEPPAETPVWSLEETGPERELGLVLFEAEEALARGSAEKAVVLASKAVKERPDSLTARALHERARRELLRGRRRERLEARVREAEGLLHSGDAAGAERIVTSALKLIPNHPVALGLFARLKELRQQATTAEAWAEQELERLTQARARRSLDTAQAEMAAGRERAAMMALRRGLRHAPDDPQLLAMLHDVEKAMERAKVGQHAVHAQVRAGQELLAQGHVEESLKVLRAVLRADPDNVRAQAAVQQVRKTWLRRQAVAAAAPPVEPPPLPMEPPPIPVKSPPLPMEPPPIPVRSTRPPVPPAPAVARPPVRAAAPTTTAPARPAPSVRPTAAPALEAEAQAVSWQDVEAAARGIVPPPIPPRKPPPPSAPSAASARVPAPGPPRAPASPRAAAPSRAPAPPRAPAPAVAPEAGRRALPLGAIAAGAAVLIGMGVIVVSRRSASPPPAPVAAAGSVAAPATAPRQAEPAPAPMPQVPGALANAEPDLRSAVEAVLGAYARALETADADLLAQARPDLNADERARLIAPFTGALNAATDLRVLDVNTRGDLAAVQVLRTDVIVGGPSGPRDPAEETLRFWRRRDEWVLVR